MTPYYCSSAPIRSRSFPYLLLLRFRPGTGHGGGSASQANWQTAQTQKLLTLDARWRSPRKLKNQRKATSEYSQLTVAERQKHLSSLTKSRKAGTLRSLPIFLGCCNCSALRLSCWCLLLGLRFFLGLLAAEVETCELYHRFGDLFLDAVLFLGVCRYGQPAGDYNLATFGDGLEHALAQAIPG